jgi:ABC-type branched-subunit amino acid transport system substrate-binding protein
MNRKGFLELSFQCGLGCSAFWAFDAAKSGLDAASPGPAAAEVYDAVRLIATGLRESGPNRARLRDSLAKVTGFAGVSGNISFDGAGNNRAEVALAPFK